MGSVRIDEGVGLKKNFFLFMSIKINQYSFLQLKSLLDTFVFKVDAGCETFLEARSARFVH